MDNLQPPRLLLRLSDQTAIYGVTKVGALRSKNTGTCIIGNITYQSGINISDWCECLIVEWSMRCLCLSIASRHLLNWS